MGTYRARYKAPQGGLHFSAPESLNLIRGAAGCHKGGQSFGKLRRLRIVRKGVRKDVGRCKG